MCWKTDNDGKWSQASMAANKDGLAVTSAFITLIMVLALISTVGAFDHSQKQPNVTGLMGLGVMSLIVFLLSLYPTVFVITQTSAAFKAFNSMQNAEEKVDRIRKWRNRLMGVDGGEDDDSSDSSDSAGY